MHAKIRKIQTDQLTSQGLPSSAGCPLIILGILTPEQDRKRNRDVQQPL